MKKTFFFLILIISAVACTTKPVEDNALSDSEKNEGWKLLFDGKTTDGWHLYNQGKVDSASWSVQKGELVVNSDSIGIVHGDLVSDQIYQNFELLFDWKIGKAGNSGVFINVNEQDSIPTAWASGPEYQLLDHQNIGAEYLKNTSKHAGCLYGFTPQITTTTPKSSTEWNHSKIIQKDGKISFYLNENLTAQEDFSSAQWKEKASNSGLAKVYKNFGQNISGHIVLQEWAKGVAFKNIKIKTI